MRSRWADREAVEHVGDIERVREVAASNRLVDPLRRVNQREEGRGKGHRREQERQDTVEIAGDAAEAEPQGPVHPSPPVAGDAAEEGGLDIAA
ncbi:MAG: hypothetical protein N2109_06350 [Fimbriimonadales bacterium]|nr:hypothetical protein [Fimbriimonadales bacterium]